MCTWNGCSDEPTVKLRFGGHIAVYCDPHAAEVERLFHTKRVDYYARVETKRRPVGAPNGTRWARDDRLTYHLALAEAGFTRREIAGLTYRGVQAVKSDVRLITKALSARNMIHAVALHIRAEMAA